LIIINDGDDVDDDDGNDDDDDMIVLSVVLNHAINDALMAMDHEAFNLINEIHYE